MTAERSNPNDLPWHLQGLVARLSTAGFVAELDLGRAPPALARLHAQAHALDGSLLQVVLPAGVSQHDHSLEELLIREAQLKAVFGSDLDWPYRAQIEWRELATPPWGRTLAALDLLVSLQTDLLDARPAVEVANCLNAESLAVYQRDGHWQFLTLTGAAEHRRWDVLAAPRLVLARLSAAPWTIAMMNHPGAAAEFCVEPHAGGLCRTAYRLFADRLEKGVLLRGCVRCVVVDREADVESSRKWMEALCSAELPLST